MTQKYLNNVLTFFEDFKYEDFDLYPGENIQILSQKFSEIFLTNMTIAVISGELLFNDNLLKFASTLKQKNFDFYQNIFSSGQIKRYSANEKLVIDYVFNLHNVINDLIILFDFLCIDSGKKIVFIDDFFTLDIIQLNVPDAFKNDGKVLDNLKLLLINFVMFKIEYFCLFNTHYLKLLLSHLRNLEDIKNCDKKLHILSKEKISLMIYSLRKSFSSDNYFKNNKFRIENLKIDLKINHLNIIKEYIDFSYNSVNDINDFLNKNIFKQYYDLLKLKSEKYSFKKLSNFQPVNYENTKVSLNSLKVFYETDINSINKTFYNNCLISSKVKTVQYDNEYDKWLNLGDTNDYNYYSITRRIDYIEDIVNRSIIETKEDAEKLIDYLELYIEKINIFRVNTIETGYIPFKLPISDCLFNIDFNTDSSEENSISSNYPILILNTFVKIYSANHIKEKIENAVFKAYESKLKLINFIEKQKTILEIEKIKDDIKKTERKSIEIISVFAAIVTFAAASLNTLPKMEDVDNIIASTTLFGLVLVLFIYLLLYILDPKRNPQISDKSLKNIFFAVLISGITLNFIYLISHSNFYILFKLYHLFY